jgi:hypothetical protein
MADKDFSAINNMRKYGGNFATKLADAMVAADPENYDRLARAFPEIMAKYTTNPGVS